ncbi:hypothetical protein L917_01446 [Phytophthora nicotianae]|uniref:Uncharacterized protein n=1 Tax=Phytophthora nicotianae TaxID=4792 RepID=W2LX59_PHYNI|nr:hypothetical protein L917_01446 [Phytophthora nicotianae]
MEASGADNMQTELSADDSASQLPYQGHASASANAQEAELNVMDERKRQASRHPTAQRVRTVRLTTQVHPDMLIPYLYGERGGRSINAIVSATGCTVDYCALSPDEPERSPQSHSYVMNFLVSAGSSEMLEDATRQLRKLVNRVQVHLQTKARSMPKEQEEMDFYEVDTTRGRRGMISPRLSGTEATVAAMESKREAILDERWINGEPDDDWDVAPMQRVYYAPRVRREQPRYMEVADLEADEKTEFVMTGRRTAENSAGSEAPYLQRGQSPHHFVTRRRMRRYPDQSRWMRRSYHAQMQEAGYAIYAVAPPQGGNEQTQRIRQPRHIYQGAANRLAHPEYSQSYNGPDSENNAAFPDETADLTNENAGANESLEFVDVPELHQPVHRTHPRRSLKRPISKMRSEEPPPPPIYRQRMPYIYDYEYDEDDEWMTEDEEMAVAYGYPQQFRPVEIPVVHRRRRFDSVSSQQWSSSACRGHPQMYKRRRVQRGGPSLENDTKVDPDFEAPGREHVIPPGSRTRTSLMGQLDEVAQNPSMEADTGQATSVQIPTEDGSPVSSASDANADSAVVDGENHDAPDNENVAMENPSEAQIDATHQKPDSLVQDPALEQNNMSSTGGVAQSANDKTWDDEHHITVGSNTQSEVMPLTPIEETATAVSPQRSVAGSSSFTRKSPESRVASPPSSTTNGADSSVLLEVESAHVRRSESAEVASNGRECSPEYLLPVETAIAPGAGSDESQHTQATIEISPPVEHVVTDTIRINNHVIASLERANKVELDFTVAKTSLSVQENKFRRLENSSKCHRRLEVLCGIVYDLQCQLSSRSCGMKESRKHELLEKLDSFVDTLFTESEQTLEERVIALQTGLEHVLATNALSFSNPIAKSKPVASSAPNTESHATTQKPIEQNHGKNDDTVGMDWEEDGWFEESAPVDPASDDQESFVAHISPKKSNLKFEGDFLAIKLEEGASPRWPRELPPFVWSLLARVISSDPQSYVMRATHKRLMDEIAKGDPYYYLHPTIIAKETDTSSPLPSSPSPPCEFGCRGASALKWERKLVSQISSRMKSFDNVAYSLARSSGGKEVLNRKKMNSIIRKLHLVAMQLHSLVSHLYCVKGQATCKEVDSLPVALNNSHFERKMGVYKSRLKLVVPHKYQQQTQQQTGASEPAEELLRDTYEFFPELLLCVDIWGYNYRESQAKRHNSKSLLGDQLTGSGALFPLGFFRRVESLAFDFEHDSNGLLRCICDELLNIVCLWNDFKWTDNLETVALDRVISFETDVTGSIVKILELYAHHLQALWAVRLLDEPEQLRSVHLTQFNAYYSDGSQGSLNTTVDARSQAAKNPGDGVNPDRNTIDRLVADEIVEQRLAEEYWNRKVTALSVHNPDNDAMDVDDTDAQVLSAETISSWDQQTMVSYLLRWSDVYAIRSDVNALSAVTNHMLKHEVQKHRFMSGDGSSEPIGSKAAVDSATRHLLAAVSRAQMLIRDALIGSEKLALHSASNQLPDERKHSNSAETSEASGAAQDTCSVSNKASEDTSSAAHTDAVADAESSLNVEESCVDSNTKEDANLEASRPQEQPELKDLIQLLAVTKQDMQELCGHRPRSARMREKVQTQSVQLARQTVEIFRNIRNMYESQRR